MNAGDSYTGKMDKARVQFVRAQLEEVVGMLADRTGKPLDKDRLLEVADQSNEATTLWRSYLDLGKKHPSPMTVWDGFYRLGLVVSERGRQEAVEFYDQLVSETVDAGSAVGEEKHRLLWDNLPPWFAFGELKRKFGSHGIAVVGSTYLDVWKKELDTSSYDGLMDSLAQVYALMYTNLTVSQRVELWGDMVEAYDVEGVLWHNNLSCHTFSREQRVIADALRTRFGEDFRNIHFNGCMGLSDRFQSHVLDQALDIFG